jgi:hypothetical protein
MPALIKLQMSMMLSFMFEIFNEISSLIHLSQVPRKRRVSGPASTRKSSLEPSISGLDKSDERLDGGMSFDEARGQCYKTFYGRKLRLFIIS